MYVINYIERPRKYDDDLDGLRDQLATMNSTWVLNTVITTLLEEAGDQSDGYGYQSWLRSAEQRKRIFSVVFLLRGVVEPACFKNLIGESRRLLHNQMYNYVPPREPYELLNRKEYRAK